MCAGLDPEFYRAINERMLENGLMGPYAKSLNDAAGLMSGTVTPKQFGLIKSQQINEQFNSPEGMMNFVPFAGMTRGVKMAGMKPKDYGISHRPMQDAGGAARLHDLTASFPEDIYSKNALQYYGSGDAREAGVLRAMQALRGKPDAVVTVYRGVPKGADKAINEGDWVTLDPSVAKDYGEVVAKQVRAKDITSWADSLLEFGYFPAK